MIMTHTSITQRLAVSMLSKSSTLPWYVLEYVYEYDVRT